MRTNVAIAVLQHIHVSVNCAAGNGLHTTIAIVVEKKSNYIIMTAKNFALIALNRNLKKYRRSEKNEICY